MFSRKGRWLLESTSKFYNYSQENSTIGKYMLFPQHLEKEAVIPRNWYGLPRIRRVDDKFTSSFHG